MSQQQSRKGHCARRCASSKLRRINIISDIKHTHTTINQLSIVHQLDKERSQYRTIQYLSYCTQYTAFFASILTTLSTGFCSQSITTTLLPLLVLEQQQQLPTLAALLLTHLQLSYIFNYPTLRVSHPYQPFGNVAPVLYLRSLIMDGIQYCAINTIILSTIITLPSTGHGNCLRDTPVAGSTPQPDHQPVPA